MPLEFFGTFLDALFWYATCSNKGFGMHGEFPDFQVHSRSASFDALTLEFHHAFHHRHQDVSQIPYRTRMCGHARAPDVTARRENRPEAARDPGVRP